MLYDYYYCAAHILSQRVTRASRVLMMHGLLPETPPGVALTLTADLQSAERVGQLIVARGLQRRAQARGGSAWHEIVLSNKVHRTHRWRQHGVKGRSDLMSRDECRRVGSGQRVRSGQASPSRAGRPRKLRPHHQSVAGSCSGTVRGGRRCSEGLGACRFARGAWSSCLTRRAACRSRPVLGCRQRPSPRVCA